MARSGFRQGADPNFSMRSIARGDWDDQLTEWCEDAAETGIPLLAEFGTEVNGFWFPWNGRWNGAGGYSWRDNALYDGPESFQLAYRHIVDLCREAGANDITWFFHVDVGGWPQAEWNDAWNYYPGDDYVDWIGLSDYGPQKPGQPWESFHSRMDGFIYDLTGELGTDKPLAVLEYGAAAAPSRTQQARKARWISDAATSSPKSTGRRSAPSPTGTSAGRTGTARSRTCTWTPPPRSAPPTARPSPAMSSRRSPSSTSASQVSAGGVRAGPIGDERATGFAGRGLGDSPERERAHVRAGVGPLEGRMRRMPIHHHLGDPGRRRLG